MKKKIAIINSFYKYGSTGKICFNLSTFLQNNNYDCRVYYGRGPISDKQSLKISSKLDIYLDALLTRIDDKAGLHSKKSTKKLIKDLTVFDADLFIINNLHGYYINFEILLKFIKQIGKPVIFVLHDCWLFTGHCTHFLYVKCKKWMNQCEMCPQKKRYPSSLFIDNSKKNYIRKRNILSGINNKVIITPSLWLSDVVKQSFLKDARVFTINNGINLIDINYLRMMQKNDIHKSSYRILCVANVWDDRKGLNDIFKLNSILPPNVKITLIGKIKKRITIPSNIEYIEYVESFDNLSHYYLNCDVFFNPTYEDNYPTVNLESLAYGLPVIAYDVGGACEMIDKRFAVNCGDYQKALHLMNELFNGNIKYDFENINITKEQESFDKYLSVIESILKDCF